MLENSKPIPVNFRFTQDLITKIENFQKTKSEELGLKISKNQAVELLLADGLKVNGIK
jgi:hypothetical protein